MQKKSSTALKPRIPSEICGIQVNFCKNPSCSNFGIPAPQTPEKGKGIKWDNYSIVAAGKNFPILKCYDCGEYPPLKSNKGIHEELDRISNYLSLPPEPRCPNESCASHQKSVCHLTNYDDYDYQAWLYNKSSIHGIDCFFMQIRRRLSLLERPFSTASAARRIWHGYRAY